MIDVFARIVLLIPVASREGAEAPATHTRR
jgi:hypothetical protein